VSKHNHNDEALDDLATAANQYQVVAGLADELRARRDFLVIACYRRGIPLRRIADAAGVHYTRIRQLTRLGEQVAEAG
jgi:hypothetical protein